MNKYLISIIWLAISSSYVYAEEKELLDIKSFCRMSEAAAKNNLPIEIGLFNIKEFENPKYGHEETWELKNKVALSSIGLKFLRIEIHQGKVQSVWFKSDKAQPVSIEKLTSNKANKEEFVSNLLRVGVNENEPVAIMSEYRIKNKDGFVIRILGNVDYFQCFEYHAGH